MNEKYIPLYRKYRPQKLEEIVGQSHIKKALTNAISMGRISHAYLLTGPRGTGKTSTATALLNEFIAVNYIGSLKRGLQPFGGIKMAEQALNLYGYQLDPEIKEQLVIEYYSKYWIK